ncbi:AmpG family muropeptide MFS transporter [bacterium]|nr:AmpG family muropeptide MFS transporter [bacterium]
MEGVPYVIVNQLATIMFKKMDVPNDQLALWTSLITWPWMLKMFWGPFVDRTSTKRNWILGTQAVMLGLLAVMGFLVMQGAGWTILLALLGVMAVFSATHDIAVDGFYMLALNPKEQAFFVGIRSTAYRLAMIFGTGFLVYLAGVFEQNGESVTAVWSKVLWIGAAAFGIGLLAIKLSAPKPDTDQPRKGPSIGYEIFKEYFAQHRIAVILAFIMFYRFGESMVGKMSALFLMDPVAKGGMGLPTTDIGFIGGVVGVVALTLGGIIGGLVLSKWGLKRCLWPMVLSMNIPNFLYLWASLTFPPTYMLYGIVGVDQFGYGFGFAAYMVYLMYISQGSTMRTAHFAISTGLMALGALTAGAVSGHIQMALGYPSFFVATIVLSIPGMIVLKFLPLEKADVFEAPPSEV